MTFRFQSSFSSDTIVGNDLVRPTLMSQPHAPAPSNGIEDTQVKYIQYLSYLIKEKYK